MLVPVPNLSRGNALTQRVMAPTCETDALGPPASLRFVLCWLCDGWAHERHPFPLPSATPTPANACAPAQHGRPPASIAFVPHHT
jgi:hypothetical protein